MSNQIDQILAAVVIPEIPMPMHNMEVTDKENIQVDAKLPRYDMPKVKKAMKMKPQKPVSNVCSRYMYST